MGRGGALGADALGADVLGTDRLGTDRFGAGVAEAGAKAGGTGLGLRVSTVLRRSARRSIVLCTASSACWVRRSASVWLSRRSARSRLNSSAAIALARASSICRNTSANPRSIISTLPKRASDASIFSVSLAI